MINTVTITGNLGKDPELLTTNGELKICNFSIAVNEFRGKGDELKKITHWIECAAYNSVAEALVNYTSKGAKVTIQGHLNQRKWESSDGQSFSRLIVIADRIAFMSRSNGDSDTPAEEEPSTE